VHGIYLEDLYVTPEQRGTGLGFALLVELARECARNGYTRLQWAVLDWNTPSIEFYDRLGAKPLDDWITYRLGGDALAELGGR
jgi:GNAT superfamily N-acetyltransferase